MINITARLICVSALAVGLAGAASPYKLSIYEPIKVGSVELTKGEYKVEMAGDKAIFTLGKKTFEVPAALEKTEKKFVKTTFTSLNGTMKEIDLGGAAEKIVFTGAASVSSGTK